jgi:hypothetical protein
MAKLILGENVFPLLVTVGVMDDMALKGYPLRDIPRFFRADPPDVCQADIDNSVEFVLMAAQAAQEAAIIRDGVDPEKLPKLPDGELLRRALTPGQIWGLCDDAILDSLVRTVEAAPGEKKQAAVEKSP